MRKKNKAQRPAKTPSVLFIDNPEACGLPLRVAMNRAARRAYPKVLVERLDPLVKLPNGEYIRETKELRKRRKTWLE